ncbi:MAG: CBS domain-containing protein [Pseudomonadota bacterium]
MHNESIHRVMTESPSTVGPEQTLGQVRKLFDAHNIHHLPVVDDGKLVGIVSASDFLKLQLIMNHEIHVDRVLVHQIMQAEPTTLQPDATLRDAAERLLAGHFHALPVVDAGAVIGIVTTSDLAQYLLHHLPRGDGSLTPQPAAATDTNDDLAKMKAACHAAERYIQSGHAEHEHMVLVQRLNALRRDTKIL